MKITPSSLTSPRIAFFFPAYHDQHHIPPLVRDAAHALSGLASDFTILIVDDGSPDQTQQVADQLSQTIPQVRYTRHPSHLGYGAALRTGIQQCADSTFTCFTDGDYPIDLSYLPKLISALTDSDGVITRRLSKPYGLYRHMISHTYNCALRLLFHLPFRDINSPLKAFRSEKIAGIPLSSNSPFAPAELLAYAVSRGLKISVMDIHSKPQGGGTSYAVRPANILLTIRDMLRFWINLHGK